MAHDQIAEMDVEYARGARLTSTSERRVLSWFAGCISQRSLAALLRQMTGRCQRLATLMSLIRADGRQITSLLSCRLPLVWVGSSKPPCLLTWCLPQQKTGFVIIQEVPDFTGAPDTIRTCDLCLRRKLVVSSGDASVGTNVGKF